jgi:hypothetical protein
MRLVVMSKRFVNVGKKAMDRLSRCSREGLCPACLQPIAEGEHVKRGVHLRCYHATYRAVRAGLTSWELRVAEGKIGECEKPGRKPTNPVSEEFA